MQHLQKKGGEGVPAMVSKNPMECGKRAPRLLRQLCLAQILCRAPFPLLCVSSASSAPPRYPFSLSLNFQLSTARKQKKRELTSLPPLTQPPQSAIYGRSA